LLYFAVYYGPLALDSSRKLHTSIFSLLQEIMEKMSECKKLKKLRNPQVLTISEGSLGNPLNDGPKF